VLALLLMFLLVAVLFGVGFAVQWLWIVAAIALALWLIGFVAHSADRRWYYW
jgi:hypothetical protein